jgi:DNA mismatch repair ATPase MutS
MRRIFERFDQQRNLLTDAVFCIGHLDALLSLASVSSAPNYNWPVIVQRTAESGAILEIKGGRHPMLEDTLAQRGEGDYIPNSTVLGDSLLLTHSYSLTHSLTHSLTYIQAVL